MLDFGKIATAPATLSPFPFLATSGVLDAEALGHVTRDFPEIDGAGLFPLTELNYGAAFARLVDDIKHPQLRMALEEKFDIDLSDKPLMITVRGFCQRKDGRIHADSTDKLVTCLLYLNAPHWTEQGGCLRLLRNPRSLDDAIAEIPPEGGNFVAFRRTDNSWHGHAPFEGQRRAIMFNWMRSDALLKKNMLRHKVSALFKRAGLATGY